MQTEIDKDSQPNVRISTHKGLFKYKRTHFGISSAPSIFQAALETIISKLQRTCAYLDDLIGQFKQKTLN